MTSASRVGDDVRPCRVAVSHRAGQRTRAWCFGTSPCPRSGASSDPSSPARRLCALHRHRRRFPSGARLASLITSSAVLPRRGRSHGPPSWLQLIVFMVILRPERYERGCRTGREKHSRALPKAETPAPEAPQRRTRGLLEGGVEVVGPEDRCLQRPLRHERQQRVALGLGTTAVRLRQDDVDVLPSAPRVTQRNSPAETSLRTSRPRASR